MIIHNNIMRFSFSTLWIMVDVIMMILDMHQVILNMHHKKMPLINLLFIYFSVIQTPNHVDILLPVI